MPIARANGLLIYYAHVPKCAGSAVQDYLQDRFGPLAFEDRQFLSQARARRWSLTSPQHIDRYSLNRLFPKDFFDASFAIVRHPVGRIISAYHFQLEQERTIVNGTGFTEWLEMLIELRDEEPFLHDNHVRPMDDIVPEDAKVFHLEHGIDAIIPWIDAVTGSKSGPRAVGHANRRGAFSGASSPKITPDDAALELIDELYARDFKRFGYQTDRREPDVPPPELSAQVIAERDAERKPGTQALKRIKKRLRKGFDA